MNLSNDAKEAIAVLREDVGTVGADAALMILEDELTEMDEGRRSAITLWQMAVRSESTPPNRYALAAIIAEKMGHERSDDSPTCMDEDTTLGCRHANGHPAEPGCDTCCEYGWPCAPALAAADAVLAAALAIVPRVPINR